LADRFPGFVRGVSRPATIRAQGFEDRAALIVGTLAASLLVAAELALLLGGLVPGTVGHAIALLGLLALGRARWDHPDGRLALALAVVPVMRLASIALPAVIISVNTWYVMIGLPTFFAIGLAARALALRPGDLGIRRTPWREVAILATAGVALGLAGFVIGEPDPLPAGISLVEIVVISLTLVVFGALLEELLLRGLVQRVASELLGGRAVIVSAALTGLLYLSSLNLRYVVFMVAVALLMGIVARRTGSIAGPVAGHGVLLWTQLVMWPLVLG
jgi:membrane protease YdiL (CAAX protease family)